MKLFSVISRTLVRGSYFSAEMQSVYSTAPAEWVSWEVSWRFQETWCHLDSRKRLVANADRKNLVEEYMENMRA